VTYRIEHDDASRGGVDRYRYRIFKDDRLLAEYSHDHGAEQHWLRFTGTGADLPPPGRPAMFIQGGGAEPFVLTRAAIAYLDLHAPTHASHPAGERTAPVARLSWPLLLCWAMGLYLLAGGIVAGVALASNWSYLQGLHVMNPDFRLYPFVLMWLMKLACAVLLLMRSKWVLPAIVVWSAVFVIDIGSRNGWHQLPSGFYLAVALQGCILSFALWLHGRGYLKR
jgi:hypothetical protein